MPDTNHLLLRLALLIAPFAVVDQAKAACAPTSPVDNTTVTCSGATVDQNGTDGYGSSSDKGNTYNILSGASLAGTRFGLRFNNFGTVNNFGSITGAGPGAAGGGIFGLVRGTVNNFGAITATGADSAGVNFNGTGVVINSGSIAAIRQGVRLQNGEVTNTTTGTISALTNGVEIVDVAKVSNDGAISGGVRGISIGANASGSAQIANTGSIVSNTTGIESLKGVDVANSGSIVGNNGIGIFGTSVNAVNTSTGAITGGIAGIQATVTVTIDNAGEISGGNGIQATTVSVNNAGNIFGRATGNAIVANSANIINASTGQILAGANGISVSGSATIDNAGSISGGIFGVASSTVDVTNTGAISGAEIAIATGGATIRNAGTISGTGVNSTGITASAAIVTNRGSISAAFNGIQVTGASTIDNAGAIFGGHNGIDGSTALSVNNRSGGSIIGGAAGSAIVAGSANVINANTGNISGGFNGIQATAAATVDNAGAISGGLFGVSAAIADITNTNSITGVEAAIVVGAATIRNSGRIVALGANGVGIVGGSLNVTSSGSISGDVGIRSNGIATVTTSGTITGTGGTAIAFNANAGNTLTLAPGFVINGNVINAAADITNTLQLGGSGNGTFDVSTIGSQYRDFGSFNKVDSSSFTLIGTSTFAGPVNINGGTLAVNGNTASFGSLSVNSGGTLAGNGTVGNTTINGGTLAPGNSIGLLTVQGNLVFTTAASYLVEVSVAAADRTNVTGVATLGGATVNAVFAPDGNVVKRYTILNATGGVSGTFNPVVSSNNANLQPTLSYDANNAFLNVNLNFAALNTNQQNVANALTGFFNSTGSIPAVFAALGPGGLTQASGEAATGSQQTTFNAMNQFMGLLTDPFVAGRGEGGDKPGPTGARDAYAAIYPKVAVAEAFAQRWSVWVAGYGGSQTTDGNAPLGSNAATSRVYGTAVGADYRFSPFTYAGFALAGGGTNFSISNGLGSGRSDLFQAGAFIRHTVGPAYISAALAYGWQDITTDRTVTVAGVDQLRAKFNANAWSGRLEGGYRFVAHGFGLTPYAAGQFATFELPSYAETVVAGANSFALGYAAKSVTATRSELGLRSDKSFAMEQAILTLRGRVAWAHDFNPDRTIAATFQSLPGASFVVNGAAQARDTALATASAEAKWLNGFSLAATFEGEFSGVTRSYAGKGVARYAW